MVVATQISSNVSTFRQMDTRAGLAVLGMGICQDSQRPVTSWLEQVKAAEGFAISLYSTSEGNAVLALTRLFTKIALQGSDSLTQQALLKEGGYLARLFSNETWEMWLEHRSALGRVASVYADYVQKPLELNTRLNKDLIAQAAEEAVRLSNAPDATPSWVDLALITGGFLEVMDPTSICFESAFRKIFDHILSQGKGKKDIHITFVIDATHPMRKSFAQLKLSLIKTLKNIPPEKNVHFSVIQSTQNAAASVVGKQNTQQAIYTLENLSIGSNRPGTTFFAVEEHHAIFQHPNSLLPTIVISSRDSLMGSPEAAKKLKGSKNPIYFVIPASEITHDNL